ncbi:MAG: ZIP family metal transporter [Methyloceanibacter sp.]|jgi:zinc and cadmium transporter|uniref:ZIP family metal transporter n=1 Tax=Methyloceanibacter sp. TaxID=1965321 RepID=UPI003C6BBFA9
MEQTFWPPFIASLCAATVTAAGILAIRRYEDWALRNASYFACFAAGVLVSVSLLHIVPKAIALSTTAPLFILAGYLFMHLFNHFITAFVCDRPVTQDYDLGLVPTLGIGLHSFIDGIVYSVTFSVSAFTGILVSIGMVLHEFPEGVFTYVLLRKGGFQERAALWAAVFAAALTTPLGTLTSFPIISRIDQTILAALLALSGGALIYVGASHLLPTAEREPRRYNLLALGAGVLVALTIVAAHQ